MNRIEEHEKLIQPQSRGEVSDGFHTFNELYEHRHSLFLALMKMMPEKSWMSINHSDGTFIRGWFIAGIDLPTGMITYHLPMSYWSLAAATGAAQSVYGQPWDGHTPSDVVKRLQAFAGME